MNSLQMKVAESIANLGPQTEDKVVDVLVQRELTKRSDGLVQAIDKLSKMENEFKKMKPDVATFDDKGNKVSEYYSKTLTDQRKKHTEQTEKLKKAINKALETGEFSDVYNFGKDQGQGQGKSGQGDSSTTVSESN